MLMNDLGNVGCSELFHTFTSETALAVSAGGKKIHT